MATATAFVPGLLESLATAVGWRTSYAVLAAVVATGLADRIFQRGDAALKLGRAIWVVTSWFLAAGIAALVLAVMAVTTIAPAEEITTSESIGITVAPSDSKTDTAWACRLS